MQRQSWPRAWLMTDERLGEHLSSAIGHAAAAGAGIIVRHHASSTAERRAIAAEVIKLGAVLGISRDADLAADLGADLVHNPSGNGTSLPFSLSIHDEPQALDAAHRRPALVFVSPLFATRSHPGAAVLGQERAKQIADLSGAPACALGGVDAVLGERLISEGWTGWAGIDAWLRT